MSRYKPPSPTYVGPASRNGGPGNGTINRLVIHCTVSSCCDSADAIGNMFRTTTKPASAHYIVDATKTLQSVFDSWIAFHAPPNGNSLGIELCCSLSDAGKGHWSKADHKAMLKRAARLTAELCLAYDVPPVRLGGKKLLAGERGICGHADVRDAWGQTTHWDPGPYFPWRAFIRMVKDEIALLEAPTKPRDTRVRLARLKFNEGLDLLASVRSSRKRVKELASSIADDVHQLPAQ